MSFLSNRTMRSSAPLFNGILHLFVLNPNKPGKRRRLLKDTSNFHAQSLSKSLLVGLDLLQSLFHVLMRIREHQFAVFADIDTGETAYVLPGWDTAL